MDKSQGLSSYAQQGTDSEDRLSCLIAQYQFFPQNSTLKSIQKELIIHYAEDNNIKLQKMKIFVQHYDSKFSVDRLRQQFKQESRSISTQVKQILSKLTNERSLFNPLSYLKTKLMSINILELERLIRKTKKAQVQIKNKDVLLFIGNTGSGKSTAILKFLGYKLKKGKMNKLSTLVPVEQLRQQHKSFHTSPQAKSCTRYINAVKTPYQMYRKDVPEDQRNIVLCDSPGFGDTAGIEVDIANGVGMLNALYGANSARIAVIIPHESITADRMSGVIEIGQTISNLFIQQAAYNSTIILFNKVPADKVRQVPHLIQNKISHLNQGLKADHKLVKFLQKLHLQSQHQQNYIDPFQTDFRLIFNKIYQMKPIKDIRYSFQYQFSRKTQNEINRFVRNQVTQVQQMLNSNTRQAEFHYKVINKLHNIVPISSYRNEIRSFIHQWSLKMLDRFSALMSAVKWEEALSYKQKLQQAKKLKDKLAQISTLFTEINLTKITDDIDQIGNEKETFLLQEYKDNFYITEESMGIIDIFNNLLDSDFKKKLAYTFEKKYQAVYKQLISEIKLERYQDIDEKIERLNFYSHNFVKMEGKECIQVSRYRIKEIKKYLSQQIANKFAFIQNIFGQQFKPLSQNILLQINLKIHQIKSIKSSRLLNHQKSKLQKRLQGCIKTIRERCIANIADLQTFQFSQIENYFFDKENILQKKMEVDSLIKIQQIENDIDYHFEQTKQRVESKYQEYTKKLKDYIKALKDQKVGELDRRINTIQNSFKNLKEYCQIINPRYEYQWMIQQIKEQFQQYLEGQYKIYYFYIQTYISSLNSENLNKIQYYYLQLRIFEKIKFLGLGQNITNSVEKIKQCFYKKIKRPFIDFKKTQISLIEKRTDYRLIHYILGNLQKISNYSQKIKQILTIQQYNHTLKDHQESCWKQLRKVCASISHQVRDFIQYKVSYKMPPIYLKQLVRCLVHISKHEKSSSYLRQISSLEVDNCLSRVKKRLATIQKDMKRELLHTFDDIVALENILISCQFYRYVENIFKSKEDGFTFGFNELRMECLNSIANHLEKDQIKIVEILTTKPNKIDFNQLKEYYQRLKKLNNKKDSQKYTTFIINYLKNIEKQLKERTQNMEMRIEEEKSYQAVSELIQIYLQSATLQKHLNYFYKTKIDEYQVSKLQKQITDLYFDKLIELKSHLQKENSVIFDQTIKILNLLQLKVYQLLFIEDSNRNKQKVLPNSLRQSIEEQVEDMKKRIQNHNKIPQFFKGMAKKTNRLKQLIVIMQRGIFEKDKEKYSVVEKITYERIIERLLQDESKMRQNELNKSVIRQAMIKIQEIITRKRV